jgi:hypothetical protein
MHRRGLVRLFGGAFYVQEVQVLIWRCRVCTGNARMRLEPLDESKRHEIYLRSLRYVSQVYVCDICTPAYNVQKGKRSAGASRELVEPVLRKKVGEVES